MDQIRSIVTGACMLSLAVALMYMIKPSKNFQNQIRFLVAALFVLTMIAPFQEVDLSEFSVMCSSTEVSAQAAAMDDTLEAELLSMTTEQTEAALLQSMTAQGIVCSEMEVSVHIAESGSISISEISVICSDTEAAYELLRMLLGEEVTLNVTEADA